MGLCQVKTQIRFEHSHYIILSSCLHYNLTLKFVLCFNVSSHALQLRGRHLGVFQRKSCSENFEKLRRKYHWWRLLFKCTLHHWRFPENCPIIIWWTWEHLPESMACFKSSINSLDEVWSVLKERNFHISLKFLNR